MLIASVSRKHFILPTLLLSLAVQTISCEGSERSVSWMGSPTSAQPSKRGVPRWTGDIILDEYNFLGSPNYLGVIRVDVTTGDKRRFLDGKKARRHPRGTTVFLQACGRNVTRVMLADRNGLLRPATPCSNELGVQGPTPDFDFSRLSPDERRVAAEVFQYVSGGIAVSTFVFDVATRKQVARFDGYYAPAWTRSGRLLVAGDGFYLSDGSLSRLARIDRGQLNGRVNNPDVHPSADRIAFEYNQQIWEMNLDGSGLRKRAEGDKELRFPAYSPDGKALVFLATRSEDFFARALFFVNLEDDELFELDLAKALGSSTSVVPRGPLSWTSTSVR